MGRKHRHWSVSEKRRIVAEANQPGTTKAAVARRHGISDSQLYAWRKVLGSEPDAGFLSVITDAPLPSPADGSSSSIAMSYRMAIAWLCRDPLILPMSRVFCAPWPRRDPRSRSNKDLARRRRYRYAQRLQWPEYLGPKRIKAGSVLRASVCVPWSTR